MPLYRRLLLVIIGILAFAQGANAATCDCTVSSASGSASIGTACTLVKVVAAADCPTITIAPSVQKIILEIGIPLVGNRKLLGNGTILQPKSTLTPSVIWISGVNTDVTPTLQDLQIVANGSTGILFDPSASGHVVSNVTITGAKVGIQVAGNKGSILGTTISGSVQQGIVINGSDYKIINGNTINTNGSSGVTVLSGSGNLIQANSIFDNKANGITLLENTNENIKSPTELRAIYFDDSGKSYAIVGKVAANTTVDLYEAAGSDVAGAQGKIYIPVAATDFTKNLIASADGQSNLFVIKVDGSKLDPSKTFVLTATTVNNSSSAFSTPLTPSATHWKGVAACLDLTNKDAAFYRSALLNYPTLDPWYDFVFGGGFDGDFTSPISEDKNQNCVVDAGETNPNVYDVKSPIDTMIESWNKWKIGGVPMPNFNFSPSGFTDSDTDGVLDIVDNCPTVQNPKANGKQLDTDGDVAGDACDSDDDNDGLSDLDETVIGTSPTNPDSDGDHICDGPGMGFANICQQPSDNCPLQQPWMTVTSQNQSQNDADEDGIGDVCDKDLLLNSTTLDSDEDKANDAVDNCPFLPNPKVFAAGAVEATQTDTDKDGAGNICDPDDDNDGLLDTTESAGQFSNSKGLLKNLDPLNPDSDEDNFCDGPSLGFDKKCEQINDNCPLIKNHEQIDSDGDGVGDACEDNTDLSVDDIDGDGKPNTQDNCKLIRNPSQSDLDGDKIGDACDPDMDQDGLADVTETKLLHFWEADSDHYKDGNYDNYCDGNGPGFGNGHSHCIYFPDAADTCPKHYNPDQGDLSTCKETTPGVGSCAVDSDGDSVVDCQDNCQLAFNPNQKDLDKDTQGDICDDDDDGDGKKDTADNCPLISNPNDPTGSACKTPDPVINPPLPPLTPSYNAIQGGSGCSLSLSQSISGSPMLGVLLLITLVGFAWQRRFY